MENSFLSSFRSDSFSYDLYFSGALDRAGVARDASGMSFDCQLFDKIGITASRVYLDMRCSCLFFFWSYLYKYNSVGHYLFHLRQSLVGSWFGSGIIVVGLSRRADGEATPREVASF